MTFLGNIMALAGVALIILGVFGAAPGTRNEKGKGFDGVDKTVAAALKELPELIKALGEAPKWLSMIIVGIALVWFGFRLSVPAWPFT